MREIKFRQKNKNNGHWHYWGTVDGVWVNPLLQDNYVAPDKSDQYTDLKDSKNREIYEGDILFESTLPHKGLVEFENRCFALKYTDQFTDMGDTYYPIYEKLKYYEVIGNIYETPELLKENK